MPKARTLSAYKKKRDFKATREPAGKVGGEGRLYVIQRHDARRLHFDLRLQHAGVLLSWAVPKEPTMETTVKRLAVRVEDHPISYGTFEGSIPHGSYGAGDVEIWDTGTWEPHGDVDQSLQEGNLKFRIDGEKLKGEFDLVRMGEPSEKENWLLIKRKEDSVPVNTELDFMLCQKQSHRVNGNGWIHEIKWDGYRVLITREGKTISIITRGKNKLSLPHLEKIMLNFLPDGAIIDGELVVIDESGKSSFHQLQRLLPEADPWIQFAAFDILHTGEKDVRSEPIEERKKLLEALIKPKQKNLILSIEIPGTAKQALAACCKLGYEGIVSKKKGSIYKSGRNSDWVKTRCDNDEIFYIVGYTLYADTEDAVGSLVLAHKTPQGLVYAGRVGTGFNMKERLDLFQRLQKGKRKTSPVALPSSKEALGAIWVDGIVEVKVKYITKTDGGILRQSRYQGISEHSQSEPEPQLDFAVTHGDRVVDKKSKMTKQDIANYYIQCLDKITPFLLNRAVSLIRCPGGVDEECFFQRNPPTHGLKGTKSIEVDEHEYIVLAKPEAVLHAVQYGTIEFHPWGALAKSYEKPDTLVFDLDPGENVPWKTMIESAYLVRTELESIGLQAFPRLSGSKGIHVCIPIKPELKWPEIKAFVRTFAESCATKSDVLITEISKSERKGKIFLDYLRNSQHATAVASYSLRAKPGLPIACPLTWDELSKTKSAQEFTIKDIGELLNLEPWHDWQVAAKSLKALLKLS